METNALTERSRPSVVHEVMKMKEVVAKSNSQLTHQADSAHGPSRVHRVLDRVSTKFMDCPDGLL